MLPATQIGDPSDSMDRMNTLVSPTRPCCKSSPVSTKLNYGPTTRPKYFVRSYVPLHAQDKNVQDKGKKRTNGYLPAMVADTSLRLLGGSAPLKVDCPPQISIDGDVTWTFKNTTSGDQSKDEGLNSEGAKAKDTIKMDESIAQQTRCRFKP